MRSGRFSLTINRAFDEVIRGCAARAEGTWITADMIHAYQRLNRLGWAHSVEAWRGTELADTSATSRIRMGVPFLAVTTIEPMSSLERNRPIPRITYCCSPCST